MAYQSRKRIYTSRREKMHIIEKNFRIIFVFGIITVAILLFKYRYDLWNWLKTYFY